MHLAISYNNINLIYTLQIYLQTHIALYIQINNILDIQTDINIRNYMYAKHKRIQL